MLDKLYRNAGNLLQGLAKGTFVLETIGSIIAGLVMIFTGEDEAIAIGWCLVLFGWLVAFLSSLTLYGFGIIVESAEISIKNNQEEKWNRTKTTNKNQIINNRKSTDDNDFASNNSNSESNATPRNFCKKCGANIAQDESFCKKCGRSESSMPKNEDPAIVTPNEYGKIVCPNCNTEQLGNRKLCYRCETPFVTIK